MTAVEWLIDKICGEHTEAWHEEIQQAIIMEREQIQNAHLAGQNSADEVNGETEIQYFKNIYGELL